MSTFIDRLEKEAEELNLRYDKLDKFLLAGDKSNISKEDIWLLSIQKNIMASYLQVLSLRLDRAKRVTDEANPESNN